MRLAAGLLLVSSLAAQRHWAFVPPRKATLPPDDAWVCNPIDRFTLARMRAHGLAPSPEAGRRTLARRVTLDLTGLPPSPEQVDAFVADTEPGAWERIVDRLVASPAFGEHMALPWLDAARYADSNGYQHDGDRQNWPWRDWLIRSLNANVPINRLTVEMLAGDLLENPTQDQIVATAFNRHHPINNEGGAIPAEVRFNYVVDRVHTTATTFLGLTMACAQCHDHKYDPISQRDYYCFFALFDNVDETGRVDVNVANSYHRFHLSRPLLKLGTGKDAPAVMVMRERKERRETRVHVRGAYDHPTGAVLEPGIPAVFGALPEGTPRNRLGFARWLVARDNPLFARVYVNRVWQSLFGRGLVPAPEDFGTKGARPSHPKLLDWLACDFVAHGFDAKRLCRQIVCSATYRQTARASPQRRAKDPAGTWLAWSPRYRLSSFALRDAAFEISGLLDHTMFGPPVFPYHPKGLWRDVSFGKFGYPHGRPGNQHRRSIYSFWRRTVAPPNLFDAADRLRCSVRPHRTNTPLHALVLLNEPGFVEAARELGKRVCRERAGDAARLVRLFRLATQRRPDAREMRVLQRALARSGWTTVAQLVLNLDEVLARP